MRVPKAGAYGILKAAHAINREAMVLGLILLVALVALEILLAIYRFKAKAIHNRTTAAFRIAEVAAMAALCVLSVFQWGLRYYALAAVLALAAAGSLLSLARSGKVQYTHTRVVRRLAGMALLLFVALLPAIVFPEYAPLPTTGAHAVQSSVDFFTDENRLETYNDKGEARRLVVEFWYPAESEGKYPLIVFSHGSFGIRGSNETLFRELASHGYVVCSIDHTYQCLYTQRENGETVWMDGDYVSEIRAENAKEDKLKSLSLYRKWMGVRVADIQFVIDTVVSKAKDNPSDAVYGLVNPGRIGVIGHSLGGSAALGVGRARKDVGAVVALEAPFLCDIAAVEDNAFVFDGTDYPVPLLNIYSDSAWPRLEEWPQYAENARMLSGADADTRNLHIEGAGHLSLTDLSLSSPVLARILTGHKSTIGAEQCLRTINRACLEFFDRHLKNEIAERTCSMAGAQCYPSLFS